MAGAISIGSVVFTVVPDARGVDRTLREQLEPTVAQVGDDLGKTLGDGIADGVGDPVEDAIVKGGQQAQPAAKTTGEELGDTLGKGIKDKVSPAIPDGLGEGSQKAKPPARTQGSAVGGVFAGAFKDRVKAALASLPKATVDADAGPADGKLAEIRAQLADLSSKRLGVDIDAAAALARLAEIKAELEDLKTSAADVSVRVDAAAAIAQLEAVEAKVDDLDRKTANPKVRADTSGALGDIGRVAAGLGALTAIPFVATIVVGVAGLGAGGLAAGLGLGALGASAVPGLSAVKNALSAVTSARTASTTATSAGTSASSAAAEQALQEAGAEQSLAEAKRSAAYSDAQAVAQVTAAEQSLTQAQQASLTAQKAVSDARVQAAQDLQDLSNQLIDAGLAQRQDQLALGQAQQQLAATLANPAATADQKAQAQLAVDQAVQALAEQGVAYQRLQVQAAAADKAGVAGSSTVVSAQQAAAQAATAVQTAETQLAAARAAQVQAQLQGADQIASAQRQIAELALQTATSAGSAGTAQQTAAQKAKLALDALTPSERAVFNAQQGLATAFAGWGKGLEPKVFPLIATGLGLVTKALPLFTPLVTGAATGLGTLETKVAKALGSPYWKSFAGQVGGATGPAISGFGIALGHVATGVSGVVSAFLPYAPRLIGDLDQLTGKFSAWGIALGGSSGFHTFIGYISANGGQVVTVIKGISTAAGTIVKDLAPLGGKVLTLDGAIATLVTDVGRFSPGLVQWGVGATLAYKGLKPLVGGVSNLIGDEKSGIKGITAAFKTGGDEGSTFGGILVKFKGWAGTAASSIGGAASGSWSTFTGLLSTGATNAKALGGNIVTAAGKAASAVGSGLQAGATAVASVATSAGAAAVNLGRAGIAYAATGVKAGIGAIATSASAVATWAATTATGAWAIATGTLNTVMDANPIVLVGIAVVALVAAVILAYQHFTIFRDLVHDAWHVVGDAAEGAWRDVIKPVFDAFKRAVDDIPGGFDTAVRGIDTAWHKVGGVLATPVNWAIQYVYNDGLAALWNGVVGHIGLGSLKLPLLSKIGSPPPAPKLASGGIVPAGPMIVNSPRAIVGEGNPRYPEYVIPTDPQYRARAVALHAQAGTQLLAGGGILGDVSGALGSLGGLVGTGVSLAGSAAGFLASVVVDPAGAWRRLVAGVLGDLRSIEGTEFGRLVAGVPTALAGQMGSALVSAVTHISGTDATNHAPGGGGRTGVPSRYDSGGYLPPGLSWTYNGTAAPEPVLTTTQWDALGAGSHAPAQPARGGNVLYVYPPAASAEATAAEVIRRMNHAGIS